jgi:hypothetical protein
MTVSLSLTILNYSWLPGLEWFFWLYNEWYLGI